jgi:hypothetical protein
MKNSSIAAKGQAETACKQYCLSEGETQGNIAYTQNVSQFKMMDYLKNMHLTADVT